MQCLGQCWKAHIAYSVLSSHCQTQEGPNTGENLKTLKEKLKIEHFITFQRIEKNENSNTSIFSTTNNPQAHNYREWLGCV
jgi:hypothetical protein